MALYSGSVAANDITPERVYLRRREFIRNSLLFAGTSISVGGTLLWLMRGLRAKDQKQLVNPAATESRPLTIAQRKDYSAGEAKTPYESVTTYNNFYEFGTDKSDP